MSFKQSKKSVFFKYFTLKIKKVMKSLYRPGKALTVQDDEVPTIPR